MGINLRQVAEELVAHEGNRNCNFWDAVSTHDWSAAVARAYLAEHPADEDEPLSEEWASTLSFRQVVDGDAIWILGTSDVGRTVGLLYRNDDTGKWWALYMGGVKLQMMTTRGDVRCLCAALGIDLKQPGATA